MLNQSRRGGISVLHLLRQLEASHTNPAMSLVETISIPASYAYCKPKKVQFQHFLSSFIHSPPQRTLVDSFPQSVQHYARLARLDKPIGSWLLAWPCFWSIALAAPPGSFPDLKMLALFGCGSVLLRGAGCTINDLWDRDLDRQVDRTKSRPLAAGHVSTLQAIAFLGAQLTAGLGILYQLNPYSQVLGASSLGLVVLYPLAKRVTGWPQAVLGLTFNWGALLGWSAVQGYCDWSVVIPLYLSGVFWTLIYDTIYAHQDKLDDARVGIGSTALTFGASTKTYLTGFALGNIAMLEVTGAVTNSGMPFHAGVLAAAMHLAWQIRTVNLSDPGDCMAKFVSNKWYGAILFTGIVADTILI